MHPVLTALQSTLGRKYIMALTGIGLLLFVIAHLLGNLQIFLGPEVLNAYAHFLQSNPEIVWPARLGLLALVGLHIGSAISLARENRAARPVPYGSGAAPVAASYASRTMMMSGLIIAAFVVYHLLHFTVQVKAVNLTGHDFLQLKDPSTGGHDVYRMMVIGFSNGWVSGFYILAMALLSLHLSHGISALFNSLGLRSRSYAPWIDRVAVVTAWLLFLGYSSIPLAVFLGYGRH